MAEDSATASTNEESAQQQVTVEDLGPCRKKLRIEVPESRLQQANDKQFSYAKKQAALPGFRPGKVPEKLLKKRFGKPIRDEVKNEILQESFPQAIREEDLEVIGEPEMATADEIELPESGPLVYEAEVEIKPQITLPDFSSLQVERPSVHVTEEQIDRDLHMFQQRMGETSEVSQGEVQEEDILTGPAKVLAGQDADENAEVLHEVEQANVWVHGESMDYRGHIAGVVIDDLGKRLPGNNVGDVVRISTTGPEKHQEPRVQNQPITVVFTISQCQRVEPMPIEQMLSMINAEDEQGLRQMLRDELESRAEQQKNQEMQGQVRDQLLERTEFELPEKITERQVESAKQNRREQLQNSRTDEGDIEHQISQHHDEDVEEAHRELRLSFILDAAAQQLDVEISENEVHQAVAQEAVRQGQRPEQMLSDLRENGRLGFVEMQMREGRTLEKITEHAQVTDVDRKVGQESAAEDDQSTNESS